MYWFKKYHQLIMSILSFIIIGYICLYHYPSQINTLKTINIVNEEKIKIMDDEIKMLHEQINEITNVNNKLMKENKQLKESFKSF